MSRIQMEEGWEGFDAAALFPPPRLHTNSVTKIDKKDLNKVDQENLGEQAGSGYQSEPQDGDSVCDAPADTGHVDDLYEMEGDGGSADERELKADKEEDKRTEESKENEAESREYKAEGSEDQKSGQQDVKDAQEADEAEGAEKPIQKESEGVEEVAEATSKTSEDVHGGDEATKDIEDFLNAANDGQNPDNKGAEDGQGGEAGEGDEGEGSADSESETGNGEAEEEAGQGAGSGNAEGEPEDEESEGEAQGNPLGQEDWESKADHSATALQLTNSLEEFEAKARDEKGHRTSLPSYDFDRENSPIELEIAFQKGRELIRKFAAEEDLTSRVSGQQRWDAKTICKNVLSFRHARIPSSRYERPKEADIVILLDISGSCAQQAEMFMAIAAGAIGDGVRIYVGYNGSCRASAMERPKRLPQSYKQAKAWVQQEINRVSGWDNQRAVGEWNFREFVEEVKPKTLIIFGDWDGIDQYQNAAHDPKFRSTKFFWFANEGYGWRQQNSGSEYPEKWTKKNYFPGVYTPRDLVKALQKMR